MSIQEFSRHSEMKMFLHHIYEYQKGVRSLVLCTMNYECAEIITQRLENQGIDYLLQDVVNNNSVNLFFCERVCLDVVSSFIDVPLNKLTPEQDFMLGAMLGYNLSKQCERYCKRMMQFC